jgi:uncharacterized protein (TIGR02001 family)
MDFRRIALLRVLPLLACCCFGALNAAADEPVVASDEEGSWSLTPAVTSQYLFRGVRVAGASFQPSLDYSAGPLALGLWSSAAFENRVSGDSDPEIDFYASYSISNHDDTVSLVPGFWLYTYPDAERSDGYHRMTFEPNIALNVDLAGIRFTPTCYYDLTLEGATYELSAAFALPLKSLGTTLEFAATAGTFKWDNVTRGASPAEKNWGDYWTIGVSAPVQISANASITLGLTYSEGRNNFYKQGTDPKYENGDAGRHGAVSLSYSFSL